MLKSLILLYFIVQSVFIQGQTDSIVLKGEYQGKSIYFQNHTGAKEAGCTLKITVNGKPLGMGNPDFEIDLGAYKLKLDDPVIIVIYFKKGCAPKIVNPEALAPSSTFEIVKMEFDDKGVLSWTAKNETGKLSYKLEQFVCHKWLTLVEIKEKARGTNEYAYKPKMYSGKNTFRLKQSSPHAEPRMSKPIDFMSSLPPITIADLKMGKKLVFSDSTSFEIYDKFGTKVKKGFGKIIDVMDLPKDMYDLNYGNQAESVKIEKK